MSSGSQLKRQPSTTAMPGSTCARARTMVVLAVPFSPRTRTPPTSGETVVKIKASAMSSEPTTAENGNVRTSHPSCGYPRPRHVWVGPAYAGRDDDRRGRRPDFPDLVLVMNVRVTVAGPLRTCTGFLCRRRLDDVTSLAGCQSLLRPGATRASEMVASENASGWHNPSQGRESTPPLPMGPQ